jgi:phytol kinase
MPTLLTTPLLLSLAFLALFTFAELLHRRLKIRAEITRKIVHSGTGLLTLLFPLLLKNIWQVLFLCGTFLILLLASLRFKLLPSINAIDRVSHGSILYPVAVFFCYLVFVKMDQALIFFYLPILTLAICDPLAAFVGKRYSFGKYQIGKATKTWTGTVTFFVAASLIGAASFYLFDQDNFSLIPSVPKVLAIALAATVSEAVGSHGMDNLFIPTSVVIALIWLL